MKIYNSIKRIFDFFVSVVGIILLSPVLLAVAIIIKINSPGSVLYFVENWQKR